jgi:MFS family permease
MSQVTFIAPLVTFVGRKFGTRLTLAIGIILESAALVASSFATRTWHLFLAQGVCFGWGCSFLYVGSVGIVPQWFNRRRSFATAIAAAGSGVGGLAYSLGTEAMIQDLGLAWAFRITAILSCVMNVACTILMRDRNKHVMPNQKAFDVQLLKRYEFLLILTWAYLSTLGFTLILFTLPDNALQIGLTVHQGAIAGALVNLGMAVGRPVVGYFSDSMGRINMVTAATLLCSLFSLGIWTSATSYSVLLVYAFFGGTVCGTFWAVG